jgi:hypothetical protein
MLTACAEARQASEILLDPEHTEWRTTAPNQFDVVFETSEGNFVISVTRD